MVRIASVLALALVPAVAIAAPAPVVTTAGGKVQGVQVEGAAAYLGVPYGADTGGANRFLPPKPPVAWAGVRSADKMGPRCPQPELPDNLIKFSKDPISEDCLVLNVWTPKPGVGKRPVMVWLHGGGFSFGAANDKYYDGRSLAAGQDVVVVSVNHRLNLFGYMPLGPEAGPAYAGAGNAGQADIVAALQWVKANIAKFGGDPGNVTLFGQSGGGGKISALLATPSAKGLFQKAIIQSGSDPKALTAAEALAVRDKVLGALKLTPAEAGKLRDVPMKDLVAAIPKAGLLAYKPSIDGVVMTGNPFADGVNPAFANVPLMIGWTHDELTPIVMADPNWKKLTEDDVVKRAAIFVGAERAPKAIALYKAQAPDDAPVYWLSSVVTDQNFGANGRLAAEKKAAQPAPVYVFRTDWRSPVQDGALRAPHAVEVPFVFGTVDTSPELVGSGPQQAAMTKLFQATFAAFARSGNPSARGYPAWPRYTAETRATFIYDVTPKVVNDPDPEARKFWSAGK
jgi:para-nitrobenzyl esterase